MPERVGRLQVRDVAEDRGDVEQPGCWGSDDGRGLRVEDRGVRVVDVRLGEDGRRFGYESGRHRRVEHPAGSLLHDRDRQVEPADVVEPGRDAGQSGDTGLDRDIVAPESLKAALAAPSLEHVVDASLDAVRQAKAPRRGLADLAH